MPGDAFRIAPGPLCLNFFTINYLKMKLHRTLKRHYLPPLMGLVLILGFSMPTLMRANPNSPDTLALPPNNPPPVAEICNNGIDDDGDGLIDMADPDCGLDSSFFGLATPSCEGDISQNSGFKIRHEYSTPNSASTKVMTYSTPVAGDIDGDGQVELITMADEFIGGVTKNLRVFDANDGSFERTIVTPYMGWVGPSSIGIGDVDGDGLGEIIILTSYSNNTSVNQRRLICYEHDGTFKWISDNQVGYSNDDFASSVNLADFNHDGTPEVYVYNQVFNANTGNLLAQGGAANNKGMPALYGNGNQANSIAADMLPDSSGLELVAGNQVYTISITNPTGLAGNTMSVATTGDGTPYDGFTAVADMDNDNDLDIVCAFLINTSIRVKFWDGQTNNEIAYSFTIPPYPYNQGVINSQFGIPSIGDLNGDCIPDVVIVSQNRLTALTHLTGSSYLHQLWGKFFDDPSGSIGVSLFDFDQDGQVEVVYRDESTIKITEGDNPHGSSGTVSIACSSGTGYENPIILDVDNDSQAEIITTCGITSSTVVGTLVSIGTNKGSWAPARKVWNQKSYQPTAINEDLSIPAVQMNHSFALLDSSCGCNGVNRPVNNFNTQSTLLDDNGCPISPLPDVSIVLDSVFPDSLFENMYINYTLTNNGSAPFPSGVLLLLYQGNPQDSSGIARILLRTTSIVEVGDTVSFLRKAGLSGLSPFNSLPFYLVAGDDGSVPRPYNLATDFPASISECDYTNNIDSTPFRNMCPPNFGIVAQFTNVCDTAGFDISLTLNQGATPFEYLWDDSSTTNTRIDLTPGNYSVTVTNKLGCQDDTTFTNPLLADSIPPIANCPSFPPIVYLDNFGQGTLPLNSGIDGSSTDDCILIGETHPAINVDCSNLDTSRYQLTAIDYAGNKDSIECVFLVVDTIAPSVTCLPNVNLYFDPNGYVVLDSFNFFDYAYDNCGIVDLTYGLQQIGLRDSFSCSETYYPTFINVFATDISGLTSQCQSNVQFSDTIPPTPFCQNATVFLEQTGQVTISPSAIDNGSYDNCQITSMTLDKTTFDCIDIGVNVVTMTVSDGSGNDSNCTAQVTVIDTISPDASCQPITVSLDGNGLASITAPMVDDGSSDNCGSLTLTLSQTTFTCVDIGTNSILLTAEDNSGNQNSCATTVTVEDQTLPTLVCQPITVSLDTSGNVVIAASDIDNGSSDFCGIQSLSLDRNNFTCTDLGPNTVILTATDGSNNSDTCSAVVTVLDNTPPNPICLPITLALDGNGEAFITTSDIDGGSTDNCSIAIMSLDNDSFNCFDIGSNQVTLTVEDQSGNQNFCTAQVTIEDNEAPIAFCQPLTVTLDENGYAEIEELDFDNGSYDNCGIAYMYLDINTFGCSDIGQVFVTLYVEDDNGNQSDCSDYVTVEEGHFIDLTCPSNMVADCETGLEGAYVPCTLPAANAYSSCSSPCAANPVIPGYLFLGEVNGSRYYESVDKFAWLDAKNEAINAGGYLAVINDSVENLYLASQLSANNAWIGLTDEVAEGTFAWINGDPVNFTNWRSGQPDNGGGAGNGCSNPNNGADYTYLNRNNADWLDKKGCTEYNFLMEVPCGNPVTYTQIAGPGPNDIFPEGISTVTYQVEDNFGTVETCSFTVTVLPSFDIVCPADTVVTCQTTAVPVTWNEPEALFGTCNIDPCPIDSTIPGFNYVGEHNGNRYYASTSSNFTWAQADAAAQSIGGYLPVVNDAAENQFLQSNTPFDFAWLGLSDVAQEGDFVWSNGNPVSYINWEAGQPDDNGGICCVNHTGADFGLMDATTGLWSDMGGCSTFGFLIEVPCRWYNTVQTSGPQNGDLFPMGTTEVCYLAYTDSGDSVNCCFDVTVEECMPNYCESQGCNSSSEWIERVFLETIDNTSGNDGGYGDFTSMNTYLSGGLSSTITLYPGFGGQSYDEYWRVWIDWNRDGDFYDTDEMIFEGNGSGMLTGNFSVPIYASTGAHRMRVSMRWNGYAGPCSYFNYGEVEDYTIYVDDSHGCPAHSPASANDNSGANQFREINETQPPSGFEFIQFYPNPASARIHGKVDMAFRSGKAEEIKIRVLDTNGKLISSKAYMALEGENLNKVDASHLPAGTYMIELTGMGAKRVEKLVVE